MPYADKNKAKTYQKEYKRKYRLRWKCPSCNNIYSKKPINCRNEVHQQRYTQRLKVNAEYKKLKRKNNPYIYNYTPEQRREYQRNKSKQLREEILKRFGSKCGLCGIDNLRVLEIHHKNGGGGVDRKIHGWKYKKMLSTLDSKKLFSLYELLCANCHIIKTYEKKDKNEAS